MKRASLILVISLAILSLFGLRQAFTARMTDMHTSHDGMEAMDCVSVCLSQAMDENTQTVSMIVGVFLFGVLILADRRVLLTQNLVPIVFSTGPPDPRLRQSVIRRE